MGHVLAIAACGKCYTQAQGFRKNLIECGAHSLYVGLAGIFSEKAQQARRTAVMELGASCYGYKAFQRALVSCRDCDFSSPKIIESFESEKGEDTRFFDEAVDRFVGGGLYDCFREDPLLESLMLSGKHIRKDSEK